MIIYNSKIPKLFEYEGMTIFLFIFISYSKEDCPKWLIQHEQMHIQQQKDWWYIPYYIVYIWDYLKNRIKGMNHNDAYRNIRFEIEACEKEND